MNEFGFIPDSAAPVSAAILGQESGNNPNSPTSVDGAVGRAQIIPSTFAQYALPGENINNDADNIAVHNRIIADLSQKAGGDPARIAVGYFSGPGNIAPAGSPTPYRLDHKDGNGKSVSGYVSDVMKRIGSSVMPDAEAATTDDFGFIPDKEQPSQYDKELSDAQASTPQPQSALGAFAKGAYSPFKPIVDNTLEALKNTATATGEAISEPLNNPTASGAMAIPDAAVRTLGKAGNMIGGTLGAMFSPVQGAATASVEPTVPAQAQAIAALTGQHPNLTPQQIHQIAQGEGGDLATAVGMGMAASQGIKLAGKSTGGSALPERGYPVIELPPDDGAPPPPPPPPPLGAQAPVQPPIQTASAPSTASMSPLDSLRKLLNRNSLPEALTQADDGTSLNVSKKSADTTPSKLVEYLTADGIDLNKVADQLDDIQKIDPNARAIDVIRQGEGDIPGGTNTHALLQSIAQTPGQARTLVANMISRGRSAGADINNLLAKSLGATDYDTQNQSLQTQMKAAGPAYEKAYSNPVAMTSPALNDLLGRPAGQKAVAAAENLAANEGATIRNLDGTLNTRGVDYIKRALDDMINSQEGSGNFGKMTQAGRGFTAIKEGILNEADNLNPDFKTARAQFADPASQMNSLDAGRGFYTMHRADIAKFMATKSPVEKAQFVNGLSDATRKIVGVRDNTNPINKIWNENNRERFQAIFPDKASYERFAKGMDFHQVKMDINQALAGSKTAQHTAFNTQPISTNAISNGIRAASDPLQFVGGKVADFVDKALAKQAATLDTDSKTLVARILTTKDSEALRVIAAKTKSNK